MTEDTNNIHSSKSLEDNYAAKFIKQTNEHDAYYIKNQNLQKELAEEIAKNDYLEQKLKEGTVKISKNAFFIFIVALIYIIYMGNSHINVITNKLTEMNMIILEYKEIINKTELYNRIILEKELGIQHTPQK